MANDNITEFDFSDENLGPKPLRDFAESQAKQNKELLKQLEDMRKADRTRTVQDAVKGKGLPEKVANLVPADADPEAWLVENGDLFGLKAETTTEVQQVTDESQADHSEIARQFAEIQATQAQATNVRTPGQVDPQIAQMEKAVMEGGPDGLVNFLRANGMTG